MKKTKKALKSIILSIVCLAMVFSILSPASAVKADFELREIAYKKSLTLVEGEAYFIKLSDKELDGRTVTDVKADKDGLEDYLGLYEGKGFTYECYDSGKITFTMTLSGSGKKTVKKKCTINFIEYVNPFKKTSFIDSNVMKQYEMGAGAYVEKTNKKQKETVRYKTKKGWTITSIRFEYYTEKGTKSLKVKNNASFTYPKNIDGGEFIVKVKNKKTGLIETMYLTISFPYTDEY